MAAGPDQWVAARQFDPILLEPPRDLTTTELDAIVPDRPAFILNASGHIAYVNSRALELAGITRDTPDPDGAEYGRDESGSLNGVLYGQAAFLPILLMNTQITENMGSGFVVAGRQVEQLLHLAAMAFDRLPVYVELFRYALDLVPLADQHKDLECAGAEHVHGIAGIVRGEPAENLGGLTKIPHPA